MLAITINWISVLVASIAATVIGAIWYSPILFGSAWMKEVDKTLKDIKKRGAMKLLVSFITLLIIASVLDIFIRAIGATTIWSGILVGLIAWFGFRETRHWLAMSFGTSSMRHFLLNSGHDLVEFLVIGAILGLMG